jgi:hypothetical protein
MINASSIDVAIAAITEAGMPVSAAAANTSRVFIHALFSINLGQALIR